MPDLTVESYWCCATRESWSKKVTGSKGDLYEVVWGPAGPNAQYGAEFSCTCPGFKYRRKCHHVTEAKKDYCGWDQFINGGEPDEANGERSCPKCGGEVHGIRYAV